MIYRVVPDTDLAGYPAAGYHNNFAGYRISGQVVNIEFKKKDIEIFIFNNTYQHFWSLFHSYFFYT